MISKNYLITSLLTGVILLSGCGQQDNASSTSGTETGVSSDQGAVGTTTPEASDTSTEQVEEKKPEEPKPAKKRKKRSH